jgi:hypothetical protein
MTALKNQCVAGIVTDERCFRAIAAAEVLIEKAREIEQAWPPR